MHYDEGGAKAALFGVVEGNAEMRTIETVATVQEDGTLMVQTPSDLPPGSHRVVVVVDEQPLDTEDTEPFELPVHDVGPWPEGLSLRREDMYDDWGR